MATVKDVAAYVIQKLGSVSTWKLQKLCFYSLAWRAVWRDVRLFSEDFEAWANGPVCMQLYKEHRGQFDVSEIAGGDASSLTDEEQADVDIVLEFYGNFSGQQLSDLTHAEEPWKLARLGLAPNERGNHIITLESMSEYYGSLQAQ